MKCDSCKKELNEKELVMGLTYIYNAMDLHHGDGRYHFCSKRCLRAWLK